MKLLPLRGKNRELRRKTGGSIGTERGSSYWARLLVSVDLITGGMHAHATPRTPHRQISEARDMTMESLQLLFFDDGQTCT